MEQTIFDTDRKKLLTHMPRVKQTQGGPSSMSWEEEYQSEGAAAITTMSKIIQEMGKIMATLMLAMWVKDREVQS